MKTCSRSKGSNAVGQAAYDLGNRLVDERTGQVFDFSKKQVEMTEVIMPAGCSWQPTASELWNSAERAENRKNSVTAREVEVALPCELDQDQRNALAREITQWIADDLGVGASLGVHSPRPRKEIDPASVLGRWLADLPGGDPKNHHAHIQITTRRIDGYGLGEKTRHLDNKHTGGEWVERLREKIAGLTNEHLSRAGHEVRVDHRSLKDQGIERAPQAHLGHAALGMAERGKQSDAVQRWRNTADANSRLEAIRPLKTQFNYFSARLEALQKEGELERLAQPQATIDTSGNIEKARKAEQAMSQIAGIAAKVKEQHAPAAAQKPIEKQQAVPARLASQPLVAELIEGMSLSDQEIDRRFALACFQMFDGPVEPVGYRELARQKAPAHLARLEQAEAALQRMAIEQVDTSGLPRQEQRYIHMLRNLAKNPNTTMTDVQQLDIEHQQGVGTLLSLRDRAAILNKWSPAACGKPNYGQEVVAKVEKLQLQRAQNPAPTIERGKGMQI